MLHSILTFVPAFVAFFWLVILLLESHQDLAKRYLAFFLFLAAINYTIHGFYFNHLYHLYAGFDSLWVFTSLAGFPLFYYYIRLLTKDEKIRWNWSLILLPATALSLFSFGVYALMGPNELESFIHGVLYEKKTYANLHSSLIHLQIFRLSLFKIVFALQLVLVMCCGFKLIRDYNVKLKQFYSNIGGKDLSAVKWLLASFVFASLVSLVSNIIGKDYFLDHPKLLPIPAFTHAIFLFAIGFFGNKQNFSIRNLIADLKLNDSTEIQQAPFTDRQSRGKVMYEKLCKAMEEKQMFVNPEIRITDICLLLGSNRTYISQMINDYAQTNFCDYINTHRVEYAKQLLLTHPNLSLDEIAEQAGFSGKSSFYRSFSEKTNQSPGRYRKENDPNLSCPN